MTQQYQQGQVVDSKRAAFIAPPLPGKPGGPQVDEPDEGKTKVMSELDIALPSLDILSVEEQLCAVCEGSRKFKTTSALAEYVGRSSAWIVKLREKPAYKELVRRTVAAIASRIANSAVGIDDLFNEQIRPSVATLVEVRDNPFSSGKDRISAAKELLDKAPKAPKKGDALGDFMKKVMIPVMHMKAIGKALEEEGETELIELIEREDGGFGVGGEESGDKGDLDDGEGGWIKSSDDDDGMIRGIVV